MHVIKRDGRREPVMFDKITARIKKLCYGFDPKYIDPTVITIKARATTDPRPASASPRRRRPPAPGARR